VFKVFVAGDKHQHFKSFFRQTTFIRLEPLSSNTEKSCVSNFKIFWLFLQIMGSNVAVWWHVDHLQASI